MTRGLVRCAECARVFDLFDATDAEEWAFGHDCEPAPACPCGRPFDGAVWAGRCRRCYEESLPPFIPFADVMAGDL